MGRGDGSQADASRVEVASFDFPSPLYATPPLGVSLTMSPLTRAWHLCLLSYVVASVLYTTSFLVVHLFGAPIKTLGLGISPKSPLWIAKDTWDISKIADIGTSQSQSTQEMVALGEDPVVAFPLESELLTLNIWPQANSTARYGSTTQGKPLALEEELIFSKAFATSMNPSKIIPYFYKASERFRQDDVTITSIITSDRLDVLVRLVEKYKGTPPCRLCPILA